MNHFYTSPVTLSMFGSISTSLDSITSELTPLALKLALATMVICGMWYMLASDAQSARQAKSWGIRIVIALVLIGMAPVIINWAYSLGGGA